MKFHGTAFCILLLSLIPIGSLFAKGPDPIYPAEFIAQAKINDANQNQNQGANQSDIITEAGYYYVNLIGQIELKGLRSQNIFSNQPYFVPPFLEIENFFQQTLAEIDFGTQCPREIFAQHAPYMRYLFRLISLSFLYEELKGLKILARNMNLHAPHCTRLPRDFLAECHPQSSDMKKFQERALIFSDLDFTTPLIPLLKSQKKSLIDQLLNPHAPFSPDQSSSHFMNLLQKRLALSSPAQAQKANSFAQKLDGLCLEDWNFFHEMCDEKDALYGALESPSLLQLLLQANTLTNINQEGYGNTCLIQFQKVFTELEVIPPMLTAIFENTATYLAESKITRYPQGDLFVAGALKEFDRKGLKSFLFEKVAPPLPSPTPEPPLAKLSIPGPLPSPTAAPAPIAARPIPTVAPAPVETASKLNYLEEFVATFQRDLKTQKIASRPFELEKLFKMAEYQTQTLEQARQSLLEFTTQKNLKTLKKQEQFGEKKFPVDFNFLLFLLYDKNYQALFNLEKIIGPQFYLQYERLHRSLLFKVRISGNDQGNWQLEIIRP